MRIAGIVAPPPSPNEEVVASANSTLADRILCVRTIQQTSKPIPFNVHDLLESPPDKEDWFGCLVPVDQLEPDSSCWAQIKHLPPIHVVGKTSDDKFYEVAVAQSRVQWLLENHFPFELTSKRAFYYDVSKSSYAEEKIYDNIEARRRSWCRFIRNAVGGIVSGHGQGLDRYYRHNHPHRDLLAPIEWAILIRDILESSSEVLDRFLLSCHFLSLHLLGDLCGPSAIKLIQRKRGAWLECFRELNREKTTLLTDDAEAEMHKVALLRGLLESVGGGKDLSQHKFDNKRSTNDNLTTLGHLFGLDLVELVPYGGSGTDKVRDVLIESKPFGCNELDVMKMQQQIPLYVQIGFSNAMYKTLPASLINTLGNEIMNGALCMIKSTFKQMPQLKKPENYLPLLLYHFATLRLDNQALVDWMASVEGSSEYLRILGGLDSDETQTVEQFALSLTVLLCYELVLDDPDEVSEPIYGSYLCDFFGHLGRHELGNRRAMWGRMVCSIGRVGDLHPTARCWLDTFVEAELPRHWSDGLLDLYWSHRLVPGATHRDACGETQGKLDEVSKSLMARRMEEKPGEEWEIVDGTKETVTL